MKTLQTVYVQCHLSIHACHVMLIFCIHACQAMIILPYLRIAQYRYAASINDTEGGRAQHSPGSISTMGSYLSQEIVKINMKSHPDPHIHSPAKVAGQALIKTIFYLGAIQKGQCSLK